MAGAYTAKGGITPDPPDVPPGWGGPDIPGSGGPGGTSLVGVLGGIGNWPFPPVSTGGGGIIGGPFPPGYEPDYSFNTTVPASIAYDAAISASTQLRDQTDYTTGEPDSSSSITWSATVNGSLRRIRFDGIGSYASSVDSSYASSAGFWGAATNLDVELTEADGGEDLVLALTSTVGFSVVTDSQTISIVMSYTFSLAMDWDMPMVNSPNHIATGVNRTSGFYNWAAYSSATSPGDPEYTGQTSEDLSVFVLGGLSRPLRITALPPVVSYPLLYMMIYNKTTSGRSPTPVTFTFKTYTDGALTSTRIKANSSGLDPIVEWLTWEPSTGEVTVTNP